MGFFLACLCMCVLYYYCTRVVACVACKQRDEGLMLGGWMGLKKRFLHDCILACCRYCRCCFTMLSECCQVWYFFASLLEEIESDITTFYTD